jgi:16S rRNA (guanine966-N2)-methyltransferase
MRVISGVAKGKKLASSNDKKIRPTSDKVKMAIYNIIEHGNISFSLNNKNILDLFSGSGSLGIEALSRGSAHCLFLDISKISQQICLKNLENCNLLDKSKNLVFDISNSKNFVSEKKFDLIFADPPYNKNYISTVFAFILRNELLNKNGLLVVEEDKKTKIIEEESFELICKKIYGNSQVLFFQLKSGSLK